MISDDPTARLQRKQLSSDQQALKELYKRIHELEEVVSRRGYDTRPMYEKHEIEIKALQKQLDDLKTALSQVGIAVEEHFSIGPEQTQHAIAKEENEYYYLMRFEGSDERRILFLIKRLSSFPPFKRASYSFSDNYSNLSLSFTEQVSNDEVLEFARMEQINDATVVFLPYLFINAK